MAAASRCRDINSEVGIYFEYTGQLNYLGTTAEGMVFGYHLNENAGTVRYGAFTLLRGSDGLHVKSVAGENFFDAPSGRYTVFARGFKKKSRAFFERGRALLFAALTR